MDHDARFCEVYDFLTEYDIATPDEIRLVCCINGHTEETLNDILEVRTGYHSIEQYKESEMEEE